MKNNRLKNTRKIAIAATAAATTGFLAAVASADHHNKKDEEIQHTHQHTHDADHQHDSDGKVTYGADKKKSYDRNAQSRKSDGSSDRDKNRDRSSSEPKAVTFDQIDGRDAVGEDGETLGTITDAVVDLDSGKVDSYILATGFWNLGSKYRIGADRFSGLLDESSRERVNMSKEDMKDMDKFDEFAVEDSRELGLLSDIVGQDVEGEEGGFAGSVEDVLIDPKRGNAPYVIVRQVPSPIGGYRYNYFAVRTNEVKGMKEGELRLAIKDDQLASAPSLSSETDLKWKDGEEVYRYEVDR